MRAELVDTTDHEVAGAVRAAIGSRTLFWVGASRLRTTTYAGRSALTFDAAGADTPLNVVVATTSDVDRFSVRVSSAYQDPTTLTQTTLVNRSTLPAAVLDLVAQARL